MLFCNRLRRLYKLIRKYKIPIVITGFEPLDLLNGILALIRMLEANKVDVRISMHVQLEEKGMLKQRKC